MLSSRMISKEKYITWERKYYYNFNIGFASLEEDISSNTA
jgi:hypothetical protein